MNKIAKGCLLNVLKIGFLLLLVPFLFIQSCMYFSGNYSEKTREKFKQEVRENIPDMFPLLILTPREGNRSYEAQLIYKQDLEDFLKKNPRFTYLVPKGQENYLNKEIAKKYPWQAEFKVEQLPDGKQFLEVVYQWDDDHGNRGWYEATDKEFFPKYYQSYFGPGIAFQALAIGFFSCSCHVGNHWIVCRSSYIHHQTIQEV